MCQKILLVLPSKYVQNPALCPHAHLSHSGPCPSFSFLDLEESSPNWPALRSYILRTRAPSCSHRDPIKTEIRPHYPSPNTLLRASYAPHIWKQDFILLFSHSVVSDSLRPRGLQHARLPCPSPSPRACSHSCPLSWWWHPTTSSCRPLLLLLSVFPSIKKSFPISRLFAASGQSIGGSASASVPPMSI